MALPKNLITKITRSGGSNNYAAQHGLYGHVYLTASDSTPAGVGISAFRVIAEAEVNYKCFATGQTFTGKTLPVNFEMVGALHEIEVVSGDVVAFYAGFKF